MTERLFAVREVLDPELAGHPAFRNPVREVLGLLLSKGVRPTLMDWVQADD
jgi:hypothetical protein